MKNQQDNKNGKKKLASEWFAKAGDDELSARDILKDREGAASTVCFLSQQMGEKYLKGYLVYQEKSFPKIHQLDRLVKLCEKLDADFAKIMGEAEYLTGFYVATRYPGEYPQFSFEEAKEAIERAIKIKDFVLEKVFKV
ncbi:MAG: HEPN domain-containing protein [Patescibacteria group bacterium]|mgnify:CR=1 FL=1